MAVDVKICGLSTPEAVAAAVGGGARFLGLVFFPASPRAVTPDQAADLIGAVPRCIVRVGLFVDADDETLAATLARVEIDLIQAHGAEPPARIAAIRQRFRRPVMKAIAVADAEDLAAVRTYDGIADRLLFDARPPPGATRPGGNARTFDWSVLAGWTGRCPWMLAGGLTADSLAEAVSVSGATAVDVSSGVETAPGVKSVPLITRFLARAAQL